MSQTASRTRTAAVFTAAFAIATASCGEPAWSNVATDLPAALMAIRAITPTNVWAVGGDTNNGRGPLVVHYDGSAWSRFATGQTVGSLWWVATVGDELFAGGTDGMILRWTGTAMPTRMTTPRTGTIWGIFGASANDVWAVGGDPNATMPDDTAILWHFDGSAWTDQSAMLPSGVRAQRMYKVWADAPNDITIVGSGGVLLHGDGTTWTQVTTPSASPLFTTHSNGSVRVAVGGAGVGVVLEERQATWTDVAPEFATQMNGVFVAPSGHAVAVGIAGIVISRDASTGIWSQNAMQPSVSGELDFHAVAIDSDDGVWAVGGLMNSSAAPLSRGMIRYFGSGHPAALDPSTL